jgi:membrane protein insertase Oxa1/YidC/SpoIIIJ
MREDQEVRKIVKGGFRATLALLISLVAIILAFIAYNRTGNQAELNAKIKSLQTKMETMKNETSERLNKVREETTKALKKMGIDLKKDE